MDNDKNKKIEKDETSNDQVKQGDADKQNPKDDPQARQDYNEHTRKDQDEVTEPDLKDDEDNFSSEEEKKKEK